MITAILTHSYIAGPADLPEARPGDPVVRHRAYGRGAQEGLAGREASGVFDEALTTAIDADTSLTVATITSGPIRGIDDTREHEQGDTP